MHSRSTWARSRTGALIRSWAAPAPRSRPRRPLHAGWLDYLRGDDRSTVNVTLNMIVDNHLKFDTLVADRRIWYVWPNAYRVQMIRRAAWRTTRDNPVVLFTENSRVPRSLLGRIRRRWRERLQDMVASSKVVENGKTQRVRLIREDDYKATYGPLISLVSEKCSNNDSIDLALGRPMEEYRFVIALTYEQLSDRRSRHLRAMVMWEQSLLNLPAEFPRFARKEHETRYRTLQAIARQYRANPDRFGVVHIWRPKELYSIAPLAGGQSIRVREPQAAR